MTRALSVQPANSSENGRVLLQCWRCLTFAFLFLLHKNMFLDKQKQFFLKGSAGKVIQKSHFFFIIIRILMTQNQQPVTEYHEGLYQAHKANEGSRDHLTFHANSHLHPIKHHKSESGFYPTSSSQAEDFCWPHPVMKCHSWALPEPTL